MEQNIKTLKVDDFRQFALSSEQCLFMAKEALEGENQIKEADKHEDELHSILGLEIPTENEVDKPKKKRRVGERNPKRDQVGIIENA